MKRLFDKSQKQMLYLRSNGKCSICSDTLGKSWEADHIIPFSKGGKTILSNGQATCKKCNLKKGTNEKFET